MKCFYFCFLFILAFPFFQPSSIAQNCDSLAPFLDQAYDIDNYTQEIDLLLSLCLESMELIHANDTSGSAFLKQHQLKLNLMMEEIPISVYEMAEDWREQAESVSGKCPALKRQQKSLDRNVDRYATNIVRLGEIVASLNPSYTRDESLLWFDRATDQMIRGIDMISQIQTSISQGVESCQACLPADN